jgi:outer membrane protein OmpA-like peptidoglycan-associated protein
MKNPKIQLALALLALCALTACGNTVKGASKDVDDISDWAHNRPSTFGNAIGEAPTGYGEKPAPVPDASAEDMGNSAAPADNSSRPFSDRNLTWHQISHYNASSPGLPNGDLGQPTALSPSSSNEAPAAPLVKYGRNVDVYPVNGDKAPYTQLKNIGNPAANGDLAQQIFFAHGSAQIGKMDNKNLRELAQSLIHQGGDYRLDIIGHASRRVNGATSPMEKKMINFRMAQKRANAVADKLLKAGVAPDWIIATSLGDEQPNTHRHGKSQEAADRRSEVFLSKD